MTGIVLVPPAPRFEVNTIDPSASPGDDGVVAVTWKVRLWPGRSSTTDGDTDPNGANFSVETCQPTVPLVPPSEATSPKSTPVQVPGVGCRTSAVSKLPTPCGNECEANRPFGSIRISRTRAFRPLAGLPG